MGMDVWLPSVFDYNDEEHVARVFAPLEEHDRLAADKAKSAEDWRALAMCAMGERYNAMRATGGYYRESYPNGDMRGQLLGLLGLSWWDISMALPDKGLMPPDHARHLLAELEMRPVTIAMVEALSKELRTGDSDAEVAAARDGYARLRSGLMALLALAIEKNESLRLSG